MEKWYLVWTALFLAPLVFAQAPSGTVEVPSYTVEEKVKLDSKGLALIVVDMQNDFVNPKGKLRVPKTAETIPAIQRLLKQAHAKGVPVFFTQDWHRKDDPEFSIWGEHTVGGSWGAEVIPEFEPQETDLFIKKSTYDAFYGTLLDHLLREKKVETVIVTGTVSNICVLHTAGSAALRGYRVILPVDAVSALTEFDQALAIREVSFLYRGTITRSDAIQIE